MLDLITFLEEQNVPYTTGGNHRHVRHGWVGLQCPWCGTSSWHLGIRLSDGYSTCWRCGSHRIGDVLMELTDLPWSAVSDLVEGVRRGVPVDKKETLHPKKIVLPKGIEPLGILPLHRSYLMKRGFSPTKLEALWNVQGIRISSDAPPSIFIPIYVHGNMVSWTCRVIGDQKAKYLSAKPDQETLSIKKTLYGCDLVPGDSVIVVEGPADAWAIGPGAVAVYGVNYDVVQLEEISKYPIRVICFDNEPDAQKRAYELCRQLGSYDGETYNVCLESGADPAEANPEEIYELRKRFDFPIV